MNVNRENSGYTVQFGQRLKRVRKARFMTLDEMARFLGTSKQVLSRYENGRRAPKITTVQDYAEKLGVPLSYFLGESPLPEKAAPEGTGGDATVSVIGRNGEQRVYVLSEERMGALRHMLDVWISEPSAESTGENR